MADVFDDVGVLVGLREIVEIFRYPLLFEEFVSRPIFYPVGNRMCAPQQAYCIHICHSASH